MFTFPPLDFEEIDLSKILSRTLFQRLLLDVLSSLAHKGLVTGFSFHLLWLSFLMHLSTHCLLFSMNHSFIIWTNVCLLKFLLNWLMYFDCIHFNHSFFAFSSLFLFHSSVPPHSYWYLLSQTSSLFTFIILAFINTSGSISVVYRSMNQELQVLKYLTHAFTIQGNALFSSNH